jgi:Rrf2 family protein
MLSQTAEYALRAVLHLAAHPAGPVGATEVAASLDVPERYLAQVLNSLARAGVLLSSRGARGGYQLARPPSELKLAAVVAPFDAIGEPPQCLLRDQRCGVGEPCIAHDRWHQVAGGVRHFFQQTSVADLIGQEAQRATAAESDSNGARAIRE